MFDIAWSELLLVVIVAILVVGPKELPGLLRSFGRMLGKLRRTADEFRKHFDDAVREAGAEDLQREVRSLRQNNPLSQVKNSIEEVGRDPLSSDGERKKTKADSDAAEGDLEPPPPLEPKGEAPDRPQPHNGATAPVAKEETGSASGTGTSAEAEQSENKTNISVNGEHRAAS